MPEEYISSMQNFKVVIGMYNNLPYNASGALYEQTYQGAWRPFLSGLYKFLSIKSAIYFSGAIFPWLEENHPEYMYLLVEMVRRGQVELLGGGLYNPLSPLISAQDMTGQVESLSAFIRKTTGKRPSGAWLYEYSWSSSLPSILQNSKIQYTFLPAEYFPNVEGGMEFGLPVTSEDHRKVITIFPTFESKDSENSFMPYENTLTDLQESYPECKTFIIMADGNEISMSWEKSGLESPDVLFERTFAWFQKNCLEYDTLTPIQLHKTTKPSRIVYFSQCYSRRFKEYCKKTINRLPIQNQEYIQISKQSVLDHPLVHVLYQKLNYVSTMIALFRGDKSRKKASIDDIWKAQCGDLFWIGPCGGILIPEARIAAFSSLIEAEKTIRQSRFRPYLSFDDLNFDGLKEAIFQSSVYNCYLQSGSASVSEFDSIKTGTNYACGWNDDQFSTGCFKDYIKTEGNFERDLIVVERWNMVENPREESSVLFRREFSARFEDRLLMLLCRKTYRFRNDFFSIDYELSNKNTEACLFRFCTNSEIIAAPIFEDHRFELLHHRESKALDLRSQAFFETVDGIGLSNVRKAERVLIRSDLPFSLLAKPNFLKKPSVSPQVMDVPSDSLMFEGFSIGIGWDLSIPAEGTAFFSLSVHLEH